MILQRYFLKQIVIHTLFVNLALLLILSGIDLIQELEHLGQGSYGLSKMILVVVMTMPSNAYVGMPIAFLISTLYTVGQFSRFSELIIFRVSGVSLLVLVRLVVFMGFLFSLLAFFLNETVTPMTEKSAQRLRIQATRGVITQDFQSGFWLKNDSDIINVREVLPDATLLDIRIFKFDNQFHLHELTQAKWGKLNKEIWQLDDVTQIRFGQKDNVLSHQPHVILTSLFHKELLTTLLILPEKIPVWKLYQYIDYLKKNKQQTARYDTALATKLVYPLATIVMGILGLSFGITSPRKSSTSSDIAFGAMLGVSYQIISRIFSHLSLLNDWIPIVSIALPTLLFMGISLVRLYRINYYA